MHGASSNIEATVHWINHYDKRSRELARFKPHLLVSNDGEGLNPEALDRVPCWVEVLYTDHMSARIMMDGRVEEVEDMNLQRLFEVVDETREMVTG